MISGISYREALRGRRLGRPAAASVIKLATSGVVGGLLVISGWAIAAGHIKVLAIVLALIALGVLAFTQRGAFIGIFVLATMNGIPFLDTSKYVNSKLTLEDVAAIVLVCTALLWRLLDPEPQSVNRAAQIASRMAVLLLMWWVFSMARTIIEQDVSFIHAMSFGREYLFFASLLAVLPRVRLTPREIWALLAVLVAGVCVFAVGQIMTATGHGYPGNLIHFERTLAQSGLTRVYAHMTDLVTAGVAVGLTACFIARQSIIRRIAYPVILLLLVSVAVQLTRARWIGLVAGVIIVSIWLALRAETQLATTVRKRLSLFLWTLGFAGIAAALAVPAAFGGTVIERLLSTFTDLQSGGGSLTVRETVTQTLTRYIGPKWPVGIGFVPPSAHYFIGMPQGSIKDSDLGVLNAVVTMGVIGAILVYLPVVFTLVYSLRRSSTPLQPSQYIWLRYGGALWIVGTLVSSATLVTLFSAGGLVLTAVVITLLVNPSVSGMRSSSALARDSNRWPATAIPPVGFSHRVA